LPPDRQLHKDLARRQQIAERARPKPKASEMRFSEVADASAAKASAAEREAARQRWIAEMQAKADPAQIRRAAREAEAAKREQERAEEQAKRKEFEQQWYEREAARQAVQQQRTAEVNAQARQHWSERELPESKPAAEPVLPVPEHVDFAAVRRRMASERAGAEASSSSAARPRSQARDLGAQAAAERLQRCQPGQAGAEDAAATIEAQNAEYEVGLLHDQLKDLEEQRDELSSRAATLQEELDGLQLRRQHAEQRLERYGENPKLQAEVEEVLRSEGQLREHLAEAQQQLAVVETELQAKQELLSLATSGF